MAGEYHMKVTAQGAAVPFREKVVLIAETELRKDISLPTGGIRGVVVDDETGEPVARGRISIKSKNPAAGGDSNPFADAFSELVISFAPSSGDAEGPTSVVSVGKPFGAVTTDAQGYFEIPYVPADAYDLTSSHSRYNKRGHATVHVQEGRYTEGVEIRMPKK